MVCLRLGFCNAACGLPAGRGYACARLWLFAPQPGFLRDPTGFREAPGPVEEIRHDLLVCLPSYNVQPDLQR